MYIVWILCFGFAMSLCSYFVGYINGQSKGMIKERERKEKEDKKKQSKVGTEITLDPEVKKIILCSDEKLEKPFRDVPGGSKATIISTFRKHPDDMVYDSYEIEITLRGETFTGWIPTDNIAVDDD